VGYIIDKLKEKNWMIIQLVNLKR